MEFTSIQPDGLATVFDLDIPQPAGRPPADIKVAREHRQARCTRNLATLLEQRTELRGVYAPADLVADALRWSA